MANSMFVNQYSNSTNKRNGLRNGKPLGMSELKTVPAMWNAEIVEEVSDNVLSWSG